MKKLKAILFSLITAATLTGTAQAGLYDDSRVQKVYVSPDDILLTSNSISVWNGYGWLPVDAIHTDGIGLYYELYRFIDPIIDHWDCPQCNAYNPLDWSSCFNCGWPW